MVLFYHQTKWKNNVYRYWRVSDRVSVLQLKMSDETYPSHYKATQVKPLKLILKMTKPRNLISIINVYAPTTQRVMNDIAELDELYTQLNNVINEFKSTTLVLLAGDWNAKVGKSVNPYDTCLGKYSRGIRNNSGQLLIDFCITNDLFITNSAFQHPARHITTWENQRIDPNNVNKTITIYNQIDYIMCNINKRNILENARSYKGTEISSDHRIVVCKMSIDKYKIFTNNNKIKMKYFNSSLLAKSDDQRLQYQSVLDNKLNNIEETCNWQQISKYIIESATETIGYQQKVQNQRIHNPEIEIMSQKQKDLRIRISETNDKEMVDKMKKDRNLILHDIAKKLNEEKINELDEIVTMINSSRDNNKMYNAVKLLNRKPYQNPIIHDKDGKVVTNPVTIYGIMKEHFQKHFTDEKEITIESFVGPPRPLNNPIMNEETKNCIAKLNNNRAAGYDKIVPEFLKYGTNKLKDMITIVLNNIFEKHERIDIGKGILAPIQKEKGEKGPVKMLRPVILLPMIRKVMSNIVLNRIKVKVENYLSQSQSAYRPGRSTSDIVWTHRFLAARVQKVEEEIYITGIDMSSAFDTIRRSTLIETLKTFLNEDEVRMIRVLLSNTTLEIKTNNEIPSQPFETNIGSMQGDSLSGCLFDVYFEMSLRELRKEIDSVPIPTEPKYIASIPKEAIYADDADFINNNPLRNDRIISIVKESLLKQNLKVNETKTEFTTLKRGNMNTENWRNVKKLGSLLGDSEDILRRKQLSIIASRKLNQIWIKKNKVKKELRIKLYKTIVKSILTYNSSTWGMTKSQEKILDSFHRKQLRIVLHVKYPNKINNEDLYKETNEIPLSLTILKGRWRLFGHVLRLHEDTPARKSMVHYFDGSCMKRFNGPQRQTLPVTLHNDLCATQKVKNIQNKYGVNTFSCPSDLQKLFLLASDRKWWKELCKDVFEVAQAEKLLQ